MNPLELRKIIVIGSDAPADFTVLAANGLPASALKRPVTLRVAFWLPKPKPYQRTAAGTTQVLDARPFEIQALKDGAIEEHVQDFTFPEQPSLDEMRRRLMPVWEGLTVESLGVLPNGAPEDHAPKLKIQFTAVNQPL